MGFYLLVFWVSVLCHVEGRIMGYGFFFPGLVCFKVEIMDAFFEVYMMFCFVSVYTCLN